MHDDAWGSGVRRRAILAGALGSAALALGGCARRGRSPGADEDEEKDEAEDVLPVEDLMREHGVLRRVLLVYDEVLRRMAAGDAVPADAVPRAADLVRRFVEDYHERQEETEVFPRFREAGVMVDLVATLERQHAAGRLVTDAVRRHAAGVARPSSPDGVGLAGALRAFVRMYAPHAAREDTVLFPAFRRVVTPRRYAELGEAFEDREHALFGPHGFDDAVADVAAIERSLGIEDLAAFTPAPPRGR
jgi:hemerythrin-like domain-containing protein